MLERDIEKRVCDYAKTKDFLVYKFSSPQRAAVPDRMMVMPSGHIFFIEFKRSGQKPTPAQKREHPRLRGHNVFVAVIDNVEDGIALIDRLCLGCK